MEDNLVCVVISCWNRLDILKQNIDAVLIQDYENFKIVVVDNNSTDGTINYLYDLKDTYGDKVECEIMEHSGFTAMQTLNIGFDTARELGARYILVLDDDCILQETNSISKLVETINIKPDIGMVGCNVVGPDSTIPQADFKFAMNKHIDHKNIPKLPFRVFDYIGACALYDADKFENYDESFNIYWNEADTALNFLTRGYDVLYEPRISPVHLYSTKQRDVKKGIYYYFKNGNTVVNRYLTFKNRFIITLIRIPLLLVWVSSFKDRKLLAKTFLSSFPALVQIFYMPSRKKPVNYSIQDDINQAYTSWYFRKFYEWIFGYPVV